MLIIHTDGTTEERPVSLSDIQGRHIVRTPSNMTGNCYVLAFHSGLENRVASQRANMWLCGDVIFVGKDEYSILAASLKLKSTGTR